MSPKNFDGAVGVELDGVLAGDVESGAGPTSQLVGPINTDAGLTTAVPRPANKPRFVEPGSPDDYEVPISASEFL